MTRTATRLILLALLALAGFLATSGVAAAKPPCWQLLINDWYDGRIDKTYPVSCYRQAVEHLPKDVQEYSSARDDINRALAALIAAKQQDHKQAKPGKQATTTTQPTQTSEAPPVATSPPPPPPAPPAETTPPPAKPSGSSSTTKPKPVTPPATPGRKQDGGPVNKAIGKLGSGNADSLPIPLLVLGSLAVLLMLLGTAGFVARRLQTRRAQLGPQPRSQPAQKS